MGKKRTRSSVTSKGERRSIVAGVKAVRQSKSEVDKALHKLDAWRAGKDPWITVPNTKGPSNRPFIKVKANALYGDPRRVGANIFGGERSE